MLEGPRAALALGWLALAPALLSCGPAAREAREPEASTTPAAAVPAALAEASARFGLKMLADGFTWTAIDPKQTRFEWSGRTASGDRELLYSFWMPTIGETEKNFLPRLVESAAANLTDGRPCAAFDQPTDFVKVLGVERVITVCFEPSSYYGKEFHRGVMHGIVSKGALTIVAVLSNDPAAAVVPLPKSIGARGK